MTHSYGYRRRTRNKFKRPFKTNGHISISKTLTSFKIGDRVDIKVDGSVHKGMPFKYYHGRTGRVFNINNRSIGVVVSKQVRNRIIPKKIHVRYEHLKKSQSRQAFVERVKQKQLKRNQAKQKGQKICLKRQNVQPLPSQVIKCKVQQHNPKIFEQIF